MKQEKEGWVLVRVDNDGNSMSFFEGDDGYGIPPLDIWETEAEAVKFRNSASMYHVNIELKKVKVTIETT